MTNRPPARILLRGLGTPSTEEQRGAAVTAALDLLDALDDAEEEITELRKAAERAEAYEAACRALRHHRRRAADALALLTQVLDQVKGGVAEPLAEQWREMLVEIGDRRLSPDGED